MKTEISIVAHATISKILSLASWMKLLSGFPTEVLVCENQESITDGRMVRFSKEQFPNKISLGKFVGPSIAEKERIDY
ncbi:hypothetical protein QYZ88_015825 [Lachnospiraceae bacterium C1.1]|nr:hypothetical protein [Lachnospiraceae bacterium C1.1]